MPDQMRSEYEATWIQVASGFNMSVRFWSWFCCKVTGELVVCFLHNQIPKSGEDVNLRDPTDIAYVFGGAYAPLTVKIMEYVSDSEIVGLGEYQVVDKVSLKILESLLP